MPERAVFLKQKNKRWASPCSASLPVVGRCCVPQSVVLFARVRRVEFPFSSDEMAPH
jgi:hypothetical protein